MKTLCILVLLFAVVALGGCAGLQGSSGGAGVPATGRTDADLRGEAVSRYSYGGPKDQIFVDQPTITPAVVKRGAKMTLEFNFAVLSLKQGKEFKVVEVVNLSGKKLSMELSRKTTNRKQGVIASSLDVVIPQDLPYGDYALNTTLEVKGIERKTVSAGFKVIK